MMTFPLCLAVSKGTMKQPLPWESRRKLSNRCDPGIIVSGDSVGEVCHVKEGRADAKVKFKRDFRRQLVPSCARAAN